MHFISYEWYGNTSRDKNISFGSGMKYLWSWDSSVATGTAWMARVQFLAGATYVSVLHNVQTGSEAHPPSYPIGTMYGLFPKRSSGWGVKLTTHLHPVMRSRKVKLYLHSTICLQSTVLIN
jgi:hypothetical protein